MIAAAKRLKLIGRAGVGVDNINVEEATKHGILVMNTPEGNTLSTAELTMAMILSLSRHIPQAAQLVKSGKWKKIKGVELSGKTIGVIGLGRIGNTVAKRCSAFGMRVLGYDPFVAEDRSRRAELNIVPLARLIRESDFITTHTPITEKTFHMIGRRQFKAMKKGVRIINCARGGIVDEKALLDALQSGKVAGAALDVFEHEPPAESPLVGLSNVITTPHIGASTAEAQTNVSTQIAEQIIEALQTDSVRNAINIPPVDPEVYAIIGPYIALAEKLGRLLAQLAAGRMGKIGISYHGEMNEYNITPITNAVLKGILDPAQRGSVNYISAPAIARDRGLTVTQLKSDTPSDFTNLITVEIRVGKKVLSVSGSCFGKNDPRIVSINGYRMNAVPAGHMLIVTNKDEPGVISHLSTTIASHKVNIANMTVGRDKPLGKAVIIINLDNPLDQKSLAKIAKSPPVIEVRQVEL